MDLLGTKGSDDLLRARKTVPCLQRLRRPALWEELRRGWCGRPPQAAIRRGIRPFPRLTHTLDSPWHPEGLEPCPSQGPQA